ncbi:MAG: alpha/beta hydrolase [Chloroflexi bacterium]|nr:alpha/beta hydrolase [Chloroflexota bacterium]
MPEITRPDGAVIHYETFGGGYPLLLIAPGGVNSEIGFWNFSRINPIREMADEFMLIGMDQRHAGQSWNVPPTFSYDLTVNDQIAVLDALGVERAHVWGGCIGVAHVLKLIQAAPGRISAGVGQDPVGLDHTNSMEVFLAMFRPTLEMARTEGTAAVVRSALDNAVFVRNNAGGPFARRIVADPAFRQRLEAMSADEYIAMIWDFARGMWPHNLPFFTVSEGWLRTCPAPLLILPGNDHFHPTSVSYAIESMAPNARCLEVDCRSDAKLGATLQEVRRFLREHAGER